MFYFFKVNDISPLRKCRDRLKSLSLYGCKLPASSSEAVVGVLCDLRELVHLDLSDDKEDNPHAAYPADKFKISALLQKTSSLPKLHSLDISGKDEIHITELSSFLGCHDQLSFLGLVLTEVCKAVRFTDVNAEEFREELAVSGWGTEAQIMESLNRYLSRPQYMQKTLYYLFRYPTTKKKFNKSDNLNPYVTILNLPSFPLCRNGSGVRVEIDILNN